MRKCSFKTCKSLNISFNSSVQWIQVKRNHWQAPPQLLLGGLDRFWIKVSLGVHRGLLLGVGGVAGVHVVWGDGAGDGAQARHGDLKKVGIEFL